MYVCVNSHVQRVKMVHNGYGDLEKKSPLKLSLKVVMSLTISIEDPKLSNRMVAYTNGPCRSKNRLPTPGLN